MEREFSKFTTKELENIVSKYGYTIKQQQGGWYAYSSVKVSDTQELKTLTYGGSSYYWALCQIVAWIIITNAHA